MYFDVIHMALIAISNERLTGLSWPRLCKNPRFLGREKFGCFDRSLFNFLDIGNGETTH
jgi:hypothetical protein